MVERPELPLFAWSEDRQAMRRRRRRLQLRAAGFVLLGLACAELAATIVAPPLPRLVWNASASAPIGMYWVEPGSVAARGDMVIARTPIAVRALAARRHYIPANVPLVKRVAGAAGDRVCAIGPVITVNGRTLAIRRTADRQGRPLPRWQGCRNLTGGTLFLLMADTPDSFDGRYFGSSDAADVIGKATPLWVR